jgi:hypothetical protein
VAGAVRTDAGADSKPDRNGIHAGEKNPSVSSLSNGAIKGSEIIIGSVTSCGATITSEYMENKKHPDLKDFVTCADTGAAGAGKTFIEKVTMKMGGHI